MSYSDSGAVGGLADKEVQEFVMMEEQKAQFMMQKQKGRDKADSILEIVVGTYEELSLGYRVTSGNVFEQTFTDHSHAGCVRAASISTNGILATGSSDEMIRLFNLRKNKELGSLAHHQGSINWLEFYGTTHMFSCSEDGTIGLWNIKTWECLRTFRGHKGSVHSCAFHPSGKLALSVGRDKTLRLWNLINGRAAYTTNVKVVADFVKWSADGDHFMLVQNHTISVYRTEGAYVERNIACSSRIHSLENARNGMLLVGLEEGLVVAYDVSSGDKVHDTKVHDNRVKAMKVLENENSTIVVTGSSDSKIKVWNLDVSGTMELKAEIDTKFRITSMGAWLRKKVAPRNRPTEGKSVQESDVGKNKDAQSEKPRKKKAKIDIEFENDAPAKVDKLAERFLQKQVKKKKIKNKEKK